MSKLLFDEQPLIVSRELAKLIGLNEAIVLQQIHYWLEINRKANKNLRDGRYWTYNSMKNWHEKDFSFWSHNTVQRIFTSLVNKGYLIFGNYNKLKFDQTKWYSIDYEALETLSLSITPKWGNGSPHNGVMESPNLGYAIPENNTETSCENIPSYPIISVLSEQENNTSDKTETMRFDEPTKEVDLQESDFKEKRKKESFQNASAAQSIQHSMKPSKPKYSINEITEIVKGNISYDYILMDKRVEKNMLDEVVSVITTTICTDFRDGYISMGEERIGAEIVKDVFMKLGKDDIEYFFECFNRQTEPIVKMTAYIRTSLFRNHSTINHHTQNQIHTDMPWMAKPKPQAKRRE